MRGFLLLLGMLFFAGSMYLFYHPEILTPERDGGQTLTGHIVDNRALLDRITESVKKPVNVEEAIQMTPVVLLFLSGLFTFASVFAHYGQR